MIESVLQFLYGGLTLMCFVVGFVFLRYWRSSQHDRFFIFFMLAFWSLGASWGVNLLHATLQESGPNVYLYRLFGFVLISAAIIDKNRRARRSE